MHIPDQRVYYAVFVTLPYASFEDAMAQASEMIAAHIARSKDLHAQGKVLMSGAFLDRSEESLSTVAFCPTREAAEEYIKGDPFVEKGLVTNWSIREWANMFAAVR